MFFLFNPSDSPFLKMKNTCSPVLEALQILQEDLMVTYKVLVVLGDIVLVIEVVLVVLWDISWSFRWLSMVRVMCSPLSKHQMISEELCSALQQSSTTSCQDLLNYLSVYVCICFLNPQFSLTHLGSLL